MSRTSRRTGSCRSPGPARRARRRPREREPTAQSGKRPDGVAGRLTGREQYPLGGRTQPRFRRPPRQRSPRRSGGRPRRPARRGLRALVGVQPSHATSLSAISSTAPDPRRTRAAAAALGQRGPQRGGDLGQPEWARTAAARRTPRPRRRPSRTPPGRCSAPPGPRRRAAAAGRSECSRRPVKWIRSAAAGRRAVAASPSSASRNAPGSAARPAAALELAAARRRSRGRRRGRRAGAPRRALDAVAVGAEADDHEPRVRHRRDDQRPGRQQQVDALRDDQLADVAHDPVARRVERAQRAGGPGLAAPAGRGGAPSRSASARSGLRLASGAGRKACTSTRAARGASRSGAPVVRQHLPQPLGRVARADQHAAGAARAPRARTAGSARGSGAPCTQRAAVDLHRVGRVPGPRRGSPGP